MATNTNWAQVNKRKNDLYLRGVQATIAGFSRAVLVSVGTAAFKAAVTATWQDSGRAAHNVRMSAGKEGLDMSVDMARGTGVVGKTRAQRSALGLDEIVVRERHAKYGVKEGQEFPAVSTYLVDKVGKPGEIGTFFGYQTGYKGANVRDVTIYSPIGSAVQKGEYARRAYESEKRAHTVKEAMGAAIHFQTQFLQEQLNRRSRTKEEIDAFLKKYYG